MVPALVDTVATLTDKWLLKLLLPSDFKQEEAQNLLTSVVDTEDDKVLPHTHYHIDTGAPA